MTPRIKCIFNYHFTAELKQISGRARQHNCFELWAPAAWLSQALSGGSVHRVWLWLLFWWSPSASFHSLEFYCWIVQSIRVHVLRKRNPKLGVSKWCRIIKQNILEWTIGVAQTVGDRAGRLRFYGSNPLWRGSSTDNVQSKSTVEVPLSKVKYISSYIWRVSANFNKTTDTVVKGHVTRKTNTRWLRLFVTKVCFRQKKQFCITVL